MFLVLHSCVFDSQSLIGRPPCPAKKDTMPSISTFGPAWCESQFQIMPFQLRRFEQIFDTEGVHAKTVNMKVTNKKEHDMNPFALLYLKRKKTGLWLFGRMKYTSFLVG